MKRTGPWTMKVRTKLCNNASNLLRVMVLLILASVALFMVCFWILRERGERPGLGSPGLRARAERTNPAHIFHLCLWQILYNTFPSARRLPLCRNVSSVHRGWESWALPPFLGYALVTLGGSDASVLAHSLATSPPLLSFSLFYVLHLSSPFDGSAYRLHLPFVNEAIFNVVVWSSGHPDKLSANARLLLLINRAVIVSAMTYIRTGRLRCSLRD